MDEPFCKRGELQRAFGSFASIPRKFSREYQACETFRKQFESSPILSSLLDGINTYLSGLQGTKLLWELHPLPRSQPP